MTDPDPVLARVQAFEKEARGGVTAEKSRRGHTLTQTATDAPIARLKPDGPDGKLRIQYRSYRNRWKEVGDMGDLALPLDEAFETIAETEIFWTWT